MATSVSHASRDFPFVAPRLESAFPDLGFDLVLRDPVMAIPPIVLHARMKSSDNENREPSEKDLIVRSEGRCSRSQMQVPNTDPQGKFDAT